MWNEEWGQCSIVLFSMNSGVDVIVLMISGRIPPFNVYGNIEFGQNIGTFS